MACKDLIHHVYYNDCAIRPYNEKSNTMTLTLDNICWLWLWRWFGSILVPQNNTTYSGNWILQPQTQHQICKCFYGKPLGEPPWGTRQWLMGNPPWRTVLGGSSMGSPYGKPRREASVGSLHGAPPWETLRGKLLLESSMGTFYGNVLIFSVLRQPYTGNEPGSTSQISFLRSFHNREKNALTCDN